MPVFRYRQHLARSVMDKLPLLFVLLAFAACSSKGAYDSIQLNNRIECSKLPPSQYDECIERASKPYEEYERERDEVSEDPSAGKAAGRQDAAS